MLFIGLLLSTFVVDVQAVSFSRRCCVRPSYCEKHGRLNCPECQEDECCDCDEDEESENADDHGCCDHHDCHHE